MAVAYLLINIGPGSGATERDCCRKSKTLGIIVSCNINNQRCDFLEIPNFLPELEKPFLVN
jgi:hypothetical protein